MGIVLVLWGLVVGCTDGDTELNHPTDAGSVTTEPDHAIDPGSVTVTVTDSGTCLFEAGSCTWEGPYRAIRDMCCLRLRLASDVGGNGCCRVGDSECNELLVEHLSGPEVCDEVDNDCNGEVDDVAIELLDPGEGHCETCFDLCEWYSPGSTIERSCIDHTCVATACLTGYEDIDDNLENGCEYRVPTPDEIDDDGDGHVLSRDCDDGDEFVYPGAEEACNGVDDDCDEAIDETGICAGSPDPCRTVVCGAERTCADGYCRPDRDQDGSIADDDCDDGDPRVGNTLTEICDGLDNDCNDAVDETCDYSQSCVLAAPEIINFGSLPVLVEPTMELTLTECADGPTYIFDLEHVYFTDDSDFWVDRLRDFPIELDVLTIRVQFASEMLGVSEMALRFFTSDPARPIVEVLLRGERVE